ncbi:MAG: metallophosphoesterase, partial [Nanoarchaeota archaeon]|nr:metallophosphoesterase [Nanoarchaeota archaeon]
MTDVHLGGADYTGNNNWWEELSYPRFTDGLYEIEKLNPKPDFILITGDIVEDVSQIRWLKDFKSIIDGFAERPKTEEHPEGIKVYVVPGNHDRYEKADKFRINERLKNYFTVMGIPQDVNLLFPDLDELESQEQGYNRYNYFFDHKGMQFIGLDSGKDTGKLDRLPESDGLHNDTMKSLNLLGIGNPGIPRVVFMHNPIYHKGLIRKADGSIANNRSEFIEYSQDNNVQLVLSGHVHEAHILENKNGDLVEWEGTSFFPKPPVPLFIQTQSATKDNGEDNQHGYRIIDVKDQVVTLPNATWVDRIVTPRKVTTTTFSPKIIVDLDRYYEPEDWSIIKSDVNLKIYQNPDNNLYLENTGMGFLRNDGSFSLPYFIANNSNRVILYEYPKNTDSKFSITNPNSTKDQYDLFVSKNEGEWTTATKYFGFKVKNSNYCAIHEKCEGGFAILHTDFTNQGINSLKLKDMQIKGSSVGAITDDLLINWEELQITTGNLDHRINGIKGVELTVNGSASTTFDFISNKITIDLHSPGELQAVDSTGNITGLVNGEVKEDIPYSIYDAANETVILFVDEGVDDDLYTYKVVGSDGAPQATYGLTVTKEDKSKDTDNVVTFNATNIQTTDSSTHQYAVNWDKLEKNEKGVEVKVDKEGDGVFEKTIISDNELTEEEFTASAAQQSNSSGGSGVIHNAPLPTTINSINYPMLLAASQEGTLTYNFKQAT